MRLLLGLLVLLAPTALGHTMSEHGTVTVSYPDADEPNLVTLLRELAPNELPQGLLYHRIANVQGGDEFTVVADDGQEPPCLHCDCWSGETDPPAEHDNGTPLEGSLLDRRVDRVHWLSQRASDEDWEIWCLWTHPDFEVWFTSGDHTNGAGDERGIVPGNGDALVTVFLGDPGEGFTYSEA